MCECESVNKKPQVIEIINELFKTQKNYYYKNDVEKAIMICRGADARTRQNWWHYMWQLGFFQQPEQGKYVFDYARLAELELPLPLESDPKQAKLIFRRGETNNV